MAIFGFSNCKYTKYLPLIALICTNELVANDKQHTKLHVQTFDIKCCYIKLPKLSHHAETRTFIVIKYHQYLFLETISSRFDQHSTQMFIPTYRIVVIAFLQTMLEYKLQFDKEQS